jgi:hypothetical protein
MIHVSVVGLEPIVLSLVATAAFVALSGSVAGSADSGRETGFFWIRLSGAIPVQEES